MATGHRGTEDQDRANGSRNPLCSRINPDSNFADLYDDLTMPYELQKTHRANDAAILEAYGFPKDATESDIVARLFKMYQELTNNC